jgi:hypothetical protein
MNYDDKTVIPNSEALNQKFGFAEEIQGVARNRSPFFFATRL